MKSILVLRCPPPALMHALLEQTCELATLLPHMESARVLERQVAHGRVSIRQQWRVRVNVPALLQPHLEDGLQEWVLTLQYATGESLAHWQAESAALQASGGCRGSLRFAPALGGLGTRVELDCEVPVANDGLRLIIGNLLQRHWRTLAEAAAANIAAARSAAPAG